MRIVVVGWCGFGVLGKRFERHRSGMRLGWRWREAAAAPVRVIQSAAGWRPVGWRRRRRLLRVVTCRPGRRRLIRWLGLERWHGVACRTIRGLGRIVQGLGTIAFAEVIAAGTIATLWLALIALLLAGTTGVAAGLGTIAEIALALLPLAVLLIGAIVAVIDLVLRSLVSRGRRRAAGTGARRRRLRAR